MNPEKLLRRYLSSAVKASLVDYSSISDLLNNFNENQLIVFWWEYKRNRDYSKTVASGIPHWQTKNEEKYFELQMRTDVFHATKNANGKYVYDIPKLREHINNILYQDSVDKINENIRFNNLSFLEKLPFRIMIVVLLLVPLFIVGSIIQNVALVGFVYISYTILIITYPIVRLIIKKKKKIYKQ